MKTKKAKKLHLAAIELLGNIETVDASIQIQKNHIDRWEPHFFYSVKDCKEIIKGLKKKRKMLERSYHNTLAEIFNQVNSK